MDKYAQTKESSRHNWGCTLESTRLHHHKISLSVTILAQCQALLASGAGKEKNLFQTT